MRWSVRFGSGRIGVFGRTARLAMGVGVVAAAGGPAACDTAMAFACTDDSDCIAGGRVGVCEASGYCSFPDAACESGQRYGTYAASGLADACVEPGPVGSDDAAGPAPDHTSSTSSDGFATSEFGTTTMDPVDTSAGLVEHSTSGPDSGGSTSLDDAGESTGDSDETCVAQTQWRQDLLGRRNGYGAGAGTGALAWPLVVVSTTDASGPGSLRDALESPEPAWVVFAPHVQGQTIDLGNGSNAIAVRSNKVIDGRGAPVSLTSGGLSITDGQSNIVVHNVCIHDVHDFAGVADALRIYNSTDIWVDQVSVERGGANALAITTWPGRVEPSMRISVSRSRFEETTETMLLAASPNVPDAWESGAPTLDSPDLVFVSMWENYWDGGRVNNPQLRGVSAHLWNNWIHGFGGENNSGHGISVSDFPAQASSGGTATTLWGTHLLLERNAIESQLSTRGAMALAGAGSVVQSRVQDVQSAFLGVANNVLPGAILGPLPASFHDAIDYDYELKALDDRVQWRDNSGCQTSVGWDTANLCE